MPTPVEQLTEKQRQVLDLHNEGKNPTEIAKALGITSQAVHGHFRRLRGHGLMPEEGTAPGRAAARKRTAHGAKFDPSGAIAAVREAARRGIEEAETRKAEIADEIKLLRAEDRTLDSTIEELRGHLPAEPTTAE